MKDNKKKKRKGSGLLIFLLIIVIAAIILILAGIGGRFGFGSGTGAGTGNSSSGGDIITSSEIENSVTGEITEEMSSQADDTVVKIKISDSAIMVNEQSFADTQALKEYLLEINSEDTEYIVCDAHAVKSVYDDVKTLLDELDYRYSEEVTAD